MFISKAEKQSMLDRITRLETTIKNITFASQFDGSSVVKKPKRQGPDWTPERRAIASEKMKKVWANKKENA